MIRLAVRFALVMAVILLAGTLPIYAQQSGLTLESLSSRIEVLFSGQRFLTDRIIALETSVARSAQQQPIQVVTATPIPPTPRPTATQQPSTATFTPSPTQTPQHQTGTHITADRRLSLRRGPGNSHSIVAYVEKGSRFDVTGRNLAGSWIQVDYRKETGWLPARYANNVDSLPIVATPTPLPKQSAAPTRTPVPTATLESLSQEEWDYMIGFAKRDTVGMGRNPAHYSDQQYEDWASMLITKLREAAKNCDMGLMELAEVVDAEALLLEETGIPENLDAAARWDFLKVLTEYWDETVESSCDRKVAARRLWIVANYGD